MAMYLDSARLSHVKQAAQWGILAGVTTNPTLLKRAFAAGDSEATVRAHLKKILKLQPGKLFVQVTVDTAEEMVQEAEQYARLAPERIYIKVPFGSEGLKCIKELHARGINTLTTAVFSPSQAYMAALTGTAFIAPYLNRYERAGGDMERLVQEMVAAVEAAELSSRVMAASLKTPGEVMRSLFAGAHDVTIAFDVMKAMMPHQLTTQAIAGFAADWEQIDEAAK